MSDLVPARKSDLTTLPWVNDNPRKWEREPIQILQRLGDTLRRLLDSSRLALMQ